MIFEFTPNSDFNFLHSFAGRIGTQVQGDILRLTPVLGEGFLRRMRFSVDFSLITHHYKLKEELILRRSATLIDHNKINLLFHINDKPFSAATVPSNTPYSGNDFAIRITSTNIGSEINFPANTEIYFTVLSMTRIGLNSMLNIKKPNSTVETILKGESGFLFYENMSDDMQKTLKKLTLTDIDHELGQLRVWIKVQELLCLLFDRLLTRDSVKQKSIHHADAELILMVKRIILTDLSIPPSLPALAAIAGMSTSRLTELFRQVFGHSIYEFYQNERMEEAVHLLTDLGYTVAEAGYQLGFSNLSHFSRIFERYHGAKPKRFSLGKPPCLNCLNSSVNNLAISSGKRTAAVTKIRHSINTGAMIGWPC